MDKYQNLMCVKGLIISLDEQLYRGDQFKKNGLNFDKEIIKEYYDAILEQLNECKCHIKLTKGEDNNAKAS